MFKNILLVFNPKSSSAMASDQWLGKVVNSLSSEVSGYIVTKTVLNPFDYQSIFVDLSLEIDLVIAAGGDGTIRKVIEDTYNTFPQMPIGLLPLGTGNQLARNLGVFEDNLLCNPLEESIKNLITGKPKKIDLGLMNGRIFAVASGVGPLSDAILLPEANDKAVWKMLAYVSSMISNLAVTPIPFRVTIDDVESFCVTASGIFVSNVGDLGMGMLSPTASIEDGLLDVCILTPNDFIDYLDLGFHFTSGFVGSNAPYYVKKAAKVLIEVEKQGGKDTIFSGAKNKIKKFFHLENNSESKILSQVICMIDGDGLGVTPMEISILPKAVSIICPAEKK